MLVAPDHETVLLEQCNIDTVNHAEATLAREAATNFTPEFLWSCTLYTAVEPCHVCGHRLLGQYRAGGLRHERAELLARRVTMPRTRR